MRVVELENRQKLWRWLIVAVLGLVMVETGLAGYLTAEEQATVSSRAREQNARKETVGTGSTGRTTRPATAAVGHADVGMADRCLVGRGHLDRRFATFVRCRLPSRLALAVLTLFTAVVVIGRASTGHLDLVETARRIEARYPELNAKLLAAIEQKRRQARHERLGYLQAT